MATKKLNYLLSIAAIAALTMGVTACGSDDKDDEKTDKPGEGGNTNPGTDEKVTKFAKPVLESTTGCLIDDDCAKGLFCFQGQCGKQCDANNACASGTCDARGRCQTESSRKRNGDAIPADEMILNAEIMERPAQTIYVDMGSESVTATIVLGSHVGPIMYRVDTIEGGGSEFKTVNPEQVSYDVGNDDVIVGFKYTFEIPVGDSSLGSKGNTERVNLITSVGSFDIDLYPRQEISGFYKGAVAVQNFADANVPIRMGIEITPKNARSMNDIKGIDLYLPISSDDLLSPENVTDSSKIEWAKFSMKQTSDCHSDGKCWEAIYGANNYTVKDSAIISPDLKLNRTIRIELSGYDADFGRFTGYARDIFKGLYRERNLDGDLEWNNATAEGFMQVVHSTNKDWSRADRSEHVHEAALDVTRVLNEDLSVQCSNADVSSIFASLLGACNVSNLEGFKALGAQERTSCIIAGAESLLQAAAEETDPKKKLTSDIIKTFLEATETDLVTKTGYATFSEFLTACAEGKDICVKRTDLVCAGDLLAYQYLMDTKLSKDDAEKIFEMWSTLLRESYLGPQFSAWQNDVEIRKAWLENADAPRVATSVLEAFNEKLLDRWKTEVLESHFNVIKTQLTQVSMEAFSRMIENDVIKSKRDSMLNDYADAWQGASEALALGVKRYDALYTETVERTKAASSVRPKLLDLYMVGLFESDVNKKTSNTSLNAAYGTGIISITNDLTSLDQSFDNLVFMRDAEVAVSTSLDPTSSNSTLLKERKELAQKSLTEAETKRTAVFQRMEDRKISQASITATLQNSVDSLRAQIAEICGLPANCKSYETCEKLNTNLFECGLKPDANGYPTKLDDSNKASIGEAGNVVLEFKEANSQYKIAVAELDALKVKYENADKDTEAYSVLIKKLHTEREQLVADVKKKIKDIDGYYDLISDIEKQELDETISSIESVMAAEESNYNEWVEKVYGKDGSAGYISQNDSLRDKILHYTNASASLEYVAESASTLAEAAADFFDFDEFKWNVPVRASIKTAGAVASVATNGVKLSMDICANNAQNKLENQLERQDYELQKLDKDIEYKKSQAQSALELQINKLEKDKIDYQNKVDNLDQDIDLMRELFDVNEQYDRDKMTLDEKKSYVLDLAAELNAKVIEVEKAEIARDRKLNEYFSLVQKAQILNTQYEAANERLQTINTLYSSPATIFSFAGDLQAIESKIDLAKERIYNYLAVVEYYAVRPFVDLRRSIYLAKSPNDLSGIMDEIDTIVSACGAPTTTSSIEVSVRELMGITTDFENMTKEQRFRAALNEGNVPVDSLTRYTADQDVASLLKNASLKSGNFAIDLSSANLAAVCNAKVSSISIQLVGSNLVAAGAGENVHPTMTLFYNGQSTLTSCQPNIESIVSVLGPKTSYGKQSTFYMETRKISPVAGINTYVEDVNQTFGGFPLATSYTVLIDPTIGENKNINWDNVDDIKLKIGYTYQDVFPTSSKCAK